MIFLVFPCNYFTGWGNCSTNLARELAKHGPIRYSSGEFGRHPVPNAIEQAFLQKIRFDDIDFLRTQKSYPVIQSTEHDLTPYFGNLSGSPTIALTFADRKLPQERINNAKCFDYIVAGSEWCKKILEDQGIPSIVIHQGIDPLIFNAGRKEKCFFRDDFVVFSGGKFEDRKGQDITIKAYKVLQDRYPDVRLVTAWANAYTNSDGAQALQNAKIDLNRVIQVPLALNFVMAEVYQNTDIGIFPSRCEAGTNLVMMEYMACGKPAIASRGTGQGDLLNDQNSLCIAAKGTCKLVDENGLTLADWEDPSLESLIENLDWAYNNRDNLEPIGDAASKTMLNKTWGHMASSILKLIGQPETDPRIDCFSSFVRKYILQIDDQLYPNEHLTI